MLNKVILKGNVGRDPEIKVTQKGKQIATFFLATSFNWKDEEGEWQTHTDWHRITVVRESTVRWIKDIVQKGAMVYVEGRLSYHSWIDKHNQKRFTPHIVVEGWQERVEHLRSSQASSQAKEEPDFPENGLEKREVSLIEDTLSIKEDSTSHTPHTNLYPSQQPIGEKI